MEKPLISSFVLADDSHHAARRRRTIIIAASTSLTILLIIAATGCCCYFRRKKNPPDGACPLTNCSTVIFCGCHSSFDNPAFIAAPAEEELGLLAFQAGPTRYTQSEIEIATNGFERSVGSGGTANVYYGKLADDTEIAVKRLNSRQSVSNFTNEVSFF